MTWNPLPHDVLNAMDLFNWGLILLVIMHWLPPITVVLSFIYAAIRIYETNTIQRLIHGRKRDDLS